MDISVFFLLDLTQMNVIDRRVDLPLSQSPSGTLRGEMA